MLTDDQKYQNIISQIHELNRQNLLAENEKNEIILNKLNFLEESLRKHHSNNNNLLSDSILKKAYYILIVLLVLNIFLNIIQIFNSSNDSIQNNNSTNDLIHTQNLNEKDILTSQEETITKENTEIIPEKQQLSQENEDVVSFDQTINDAPIIAENDESNLYEEIKPIIKKDTIYMCEDDNFQTKYKIPYTVEIKGKLYSNKFEFILQNNSTTKKCRIDKNDI